MRRKVGEKKSQQAWLLSFLHQHVMEMVVSSFQVRPYEMIAKGAGGYLNLGGQLMAWLWCYCNGQQSRLSNLCCRKWMNSLDCLWSWRRKKRKRKMAGCTHFAAKSLVVDFAESIRHRNSSCLIANYSAQTWTYVAVWLAICRIQIPKKIKYGRYRLLVYVNIHLLK